MHWLEFNTQTSAYLRLLFSHYTALLSCNTPFLQRMESFTAIPDYSNYLAYIFTQMPSEPESVRWKAGLTLKNNIRTGLESYSPTVINYLKEVIFGKPNFFGYCPLFQDDLVGLQTLKRMLFILQSRLQTKLISSERPLHPS